MTKGVGRMFIKNIKIDNNFKSYLSDFFFYSIKLMQNNIFIFDGLLITI